MLSSAGKGLCMSFNFYNGRQALARADELAGRSTGMEESRRRALPNNKWWLVRGQ